MMFQADYLRALIDLGERDVWTQKDRIDAFLDGAGTSASQASGSDAVVA